MTGQSHHVEQCEAQRLAMVVGKDLHLRQAGEGRRLDGTVVVM